MRCTLKSVLVALALAGGSLTAVLPANAANVSVEAGHGGVAFGYSDGYWDRDHGWHNWRDEKEATEFRKSNQAHYYERKHDADQNDSGHGWREKDTWWKHN